MADTTLPGVLLTGDHASRPAANTVGSGTLYACSTHGLIYQSDASSWTTWATMGVGDATAHIADATDAHDASAVSFDPTGLANTAATELQAAMEDFDAAIGAAAGSVATDPIWDAAGDLAVGSGANTAAKLAIGATNGMALQRVSGAVAWAFPKGHEFDYVEKTSDTAISASSEGAADTVITANAVSYSGSQRIKIEVFTPVLVAPNGQSLQLVLYDGSGSIGKLGQFHGSATNVMGPATASRFLTPSNASHTYSVRAFTGGSAGSVNAGAGGSGVFVPIYIRQTAA